MLAAEATERDSLRLRLRHGAGRRVSELCALRWRNLRRRGDAGPPLSDWQAVWCLTGLFHPSLEAVLDELNRMEIGDHS
jgi:integrase